MNKLAFFTMTLVALLPLTITGCGQSENTVVEAPSEVIEEEAAMEGMDDEDYDAAMEADMSGTE